MIGRYLALLGIQIWVLSRMGSVLGNDDNRQTTVVERIDGLREVVGLEFPLLEDPEQAVRSVTSVLNAAFTPRLYDLFAKTKTSECRAKIAEHFSYFVNSIVQEESLPFTDVEFSNECGEPVYMWEDLPDDMHPGMLQNRTYQPPRNESLYIDSPSDLRICYGILTHDNPAATIRLIEALYETGHVFVIHVDGKFSETQSALLAYASKVDYIHVLDDKYRVRVNWGAFSMVNATLQMLRYALAVEDEEHRDALDFHKFVHLSSSTYPLASNSEIRHTIASFPLDANFLNIIMQPVRPGKYVWHYYVECDDAVHRIYQMPGLEGTSSKADIFTSSQWFIASREFASYLADPVEGTFVHDYVRYAEHLVVADEAFFGTVLRHTSFCHQHHNRNFLHLQFDRWESELPADKRDERKCPMPNPNHCGRSPTIMTVDYADILELSDDLFARKFDDSVDHQVKDIIDSWREKRERDFSQPTNTVSSGNVTHHPMEFEGHGVLIVAKETVHDPTPLCLGLGSSGNRIRLTPCFHEWVPPTLGEDWETGGVIVQETPLHLRWLVAPCTTDGTLERNASGQIVVTKGNYSTTGPRCKLQQIDGIRAGRCYDSQSNVLQPGGYTQVYPCVQQWFQFVAFGDGDEAPLGSLYSKIPSHIVRQILNLGHDQSPYMCFGVHGRGQDDEVDWMEASPDESTTDHPSEQESNEDLSPLSNWQDAEIVTTRCSNRNAVIEWVFVPYIVEDPDDEDDSLGIQNDDGSDEEDTPTNESTQKDCPETKEEL